MNRSRKPDTRPEADPIRRTVDVPTAGKILGWSRPHTYRAVADGSLPSIRYGRRIVVSLDVINRMLAG